VTAARLAALALVATISALPAAGAGPAGAPARGAATLSVWRAGAWCTWWRADRAPERWAAADSVVLGALCWRRLAPGLESANLRLGCGPPAWRARLIVARLDPRALTLSLALGLAGADQRPAWSIDRAPPEALLAVNAGQFVGTLPWGWVVIDGRQRLSPGHGPLSSAIAIDAAGRVSWVHGDSLASAAGVVTGFQSYPTLLAGDGIVPRALRAAGAGVDATPRDARLALGQTREGRLLVVLTRFDAIGEAAGGVPLGPTTPEMAAIMGALGACDAVMLDGGISAQLLLRDPARKVAFRWPGLRKVPLALIARAAGPNGSTRSAGARGRF